jgi:MFS family permease
VKNRFQSLPFKCNLQRYTTVLKEAGLSNPGLLVWAVGVPNLLGGIIALVATDEYGRRPLLLLSFGGMAGLYNLNPVDPNLESVWFQSLNL